MVRRVLQGWALAGTVVGISALRQRIIVYQNHTMSNYVKTLTFVQERPNDLDMTVFNGFDERGHSSVI